MVGFALSRITTVLEGQFTNLIDMSDFDSRPTQKRTCFLQRALAALAIKNICKVDAKTAGRSITDGFGDNGIDALFFDSRSDTLFLVQSKWSEQANKPPDTEAILKFIEGVYDLLAAKFETFGPKMRAREPEIKALLESERDLRIRLLVLHVSTQPIPPDAHRRLAEFVAVLNDPIQNSQLDVLDQTGVYELVTSESKAPDIKLQVGLYDFGSIETPFLAFYGRVHVREIKQWWAEHGNSLFDQNLRLYYPSSPVNDALTQTVQRFPEYFWYFNNGITIICKNVHRGLIGQPVRNFGIFNCNGASIVNGAQTVGTIGKADIPFDSPSDSPPDSTASWVQVRIISLEKTPDDFSRRITRAANLQNAVGNREFAAMDPLQHRLSSDFALDKRRYVYKSGDADPRGEDGCSIVEATQALGCKRSVALAVLVKREIGAVWADTDPPPYTDLFNRELTATTVWRAVVVMRTVDEELHRLRKAASSNRIDMVCIHLNRLILHLVFQDPSVSKVDNENSDLETLISSVRSSVPPVFEAVASCVAEKFPNDYLAHLCKNQAKCEDIVDGITRPAKVNDKMPTKQISLFPEDER